MKIGILGGTGLIGSFFVEKALAESHSIRLFSRSGKTPPGFPAGPNLEIIHATLPEVKDLEQLDGIVNLVGEPLAGVRWTEERKKLFRISRVEFTRGLVARLLSCQTPPKVILQGSAIGYYGKSDQVHPPFVESDAPATGEELADLCVDWEREALPLETKGIRVVFLRTGIVLSKKGGALGKMLLPFQMGVGGPIGTGNQGFSWIHEKDMVSGMLFLLSQDKAKGAFNFVSPEPCSNREFAKSLGQSLGRPAFLPTPSFAMKALFGEGASVVTEGQYVSPQRLQQMGYPFLFPKLSEALQDLLKPNKD